MFKRKRHRKHESPKVVMLENYHTLQKDQEYPLIQEGMDWYLVKHKGKRIYIFKNLAE